MFANIEIGPSHAIPASGQSSDQNNNEITGVSGRIVVSARSFEDNSFDVLYLKFRGIVLVSHQDESSIEDLITLTDVKSLAGFENDPATGNATADFHFYLPIDTPRLFDGNRNLPRSEVLRGYAYKALNSGYCSNHKSVEGFCEVSYWIEAEFRLKGKRIGCLTKHVEVPDFYRRLQATVERPFYYSSKVAGGWLSRVRHEHTVELSLLVQEIQSRPISHIKTNAASCGPLSLGLTLNLRRLVGDFLPWDPRQSLKCYVDCTWKAKVSFSTTKNQPTTKLKDKGLICSTASTKSVERHSAYFRPEARLSSSRCYVAMAELELKTPFLIQQPSYKLGLLSRGYTLEVSLAFDKLGEVSLPQIQGVLDLKIEPVTACMDIVCEDVAFRQQVDIKTQHDEGLTKEARRCTSDTPIYC